VCFAGMELRRVKAYVGQTRTKKLIAELETLGFGECATPDRLPPRRFPWFLDNGAFPAWKAGRPFDGERFQKALEKLDRIPRGPDFIVVPDKVAGGLDSLWFSLTWAPHVARTGAPLYLAVQDGMTEEDLVPHLKPFAGLFVGGTTEWKLRTGGAWAAFAHAHGRRCHIGRVGSMKRIRWALSTGADSIDSSLPLWSAEKLRRMVRALAQGELFRPAAA
jgi:hypothetical protein